MLSDSWLYTSLQTSWTKGGESNSSPQLRADILNRKLLEQFHLVLQAEIEQERAKLFTVVSLNLSSFANKPIWTYRVDGGRVEREPQLPINLAIKYRDAHLVGELQKCSVQMRKQFDTGQKKFVDDFKG